MEKEKWIPVEGYDTYEISNQGRLRNNGIISRGVIKDSGYKFYSLTKDNKRTSIPAHRLVAKHFIPNPENKEQVNHLGEKDDNRVCMLEWVTCKENMDHAHKFRMENRKRRKVFALDPETKEIVDSYDTLKEAIKNVGEEKELRKALNANIQYKGYLWITKEKERINPIIEDEIWVNTKDSVYPEVSRFRNYQVSSYGRVKSLKGNFITIDNNSGNPDVRLNYNGETKHFLVYRLVIMAFNVPNPENKETVDHIDSDRTNNKLENLRWATPEEQVKNENSRQKMRKPKPGARRVLFVIDPNGNEETCYGISELAKRIGMSATTIRKYALSGNKCQGYTFKYMDACIVDQQKNAEESEKLRLELERASQPTEEKTHKKFEKVHIAKPTVIEVTYPNGEVKTHHGITQLENEINVTHYYIYKHAKSGEEYEGYKFRIIREENDLTKKSAVRNSSKTVIEVTTPDGEVKTFYGLVNAAKELHMSHNTITEYARTKKKHNGYRFVIKK